MSKSLTFSILKNVCYCLLLDLLRFCPTSVALDHSPCARMFWIKRQVWFCDGVRVHIIVINNKSVRVLCGQTGWLFMNRSPCSYFYQFIRFPLLRRPILVSIPFWVVWWASVQNKSLRSLMLLIPWAERLLTFISGFHRALWCSRGKHVRIPFAASRDLIHHRFRFCCDSFYTWFFLCSFRHHFRTLFRTEMANVEQTQKMIPFITCENFSWLACLRVGFWCQCIWFGFWGPNWFYRTTNQEQLCGFWKHVSL